MKRKCIKDYFNEFTKGRVYNFLKDATRKGRHCVQYNDGRIVSLDLDDCSTWFNSHFEPIPETPAKYKLKKPITGRALAADGACSDELVKFVVKYGFNDCATAGFASVDEYVLHVERDNLGWLLKQGYLEGGEPERTYCAGQRVRIEGNDQYWKVRTEKIILAALETDGSAPPWRRPVKIEDPNQITQAEMDQMIDPKDFRGIIQDNP